MTTKSNAAEFPKSVNLFPGAAPVTCQKNFERNIHLCIAALEYIIAHITILLKGAWAAHEKHERSVRTPLLLFMMKPKLFAFEQTSLFTKSA